MKKAKTIKIPSAQEYIAELEQTIQLFQVVKHSFEKEVQALSEENKQLRALMFEKQ